MAYVATLIANTTRICVALEMQRRAVEVSWLTGNQLHRLEGIVIYFGFLLLLFMLLERMDSPTHAASHASIPLSAPYILRNDPRNPATQWLVPAARILGAFWFRIPVIAIATLVLPFCGVFCGHIIFCALAPTG